MTTIANPRLDGAQIVRENPEETQLPQLVESTVSSPDSQSRPGATFVDWPRLTGEEKDALVEKKYV